jgi:hypothetical protein
MKEFSEYEKRILRELIKVDETQGSLTVLGNLIDFELSPNFYIEIKSEDNCPVRIAGSYIEKINAEYGDAGLNEKMKQFNISLLFIVKLFEYLEAEKLVLLTGEYPITTIGTTFDVHETPIGYKIEDKEIVRLLYYFSKKKIVPTDPLRRLVKDNFRSNSESGKGILSVHDAKAHKLLKWSLISIIITAILATYPIYEHYQKGEHYKQVDTIQPTKRTNPNDSSSLLNEKQKSPLLDTNLQPIKIPKKITNKTKTITNSLIQDSSEIQNIKNDVFGNFK